MTWGDRGTLFVGSREAGKVHALRDVDGDGRAEKTWLVASGLSMPAGVAFRDGALYVSAVEKIYRFDAIEDWLDEGGSGAAPKPTVVIDDLPGERHHGWRYIAFGPDDKLYVPLGAPCNVCDEEGFATILRMSPDGSNREMIAQGVRNTVGFDWHPQTSKLWFTDNGPDGMGDEQPQCELNVLNETGEHFGFPHCHAGDVPDPEFGDGKSCADYTQPAVLLGPHTAPLGMRFYTGAQFPREYRGDVIVARHGSWNRSTKSGYDVVRIELDGERIGAVTPFLTGFLDGQGTLGRPVDVIHASDGALLVSDDHANAIYRVAYVGEGD
jgi:glucose/arabinose dehydrogenase